MLGGFRVGCSVGKKRVEAVMLHVAVAVAGGGAGAYGGRSRSTCTSSTGYGVATGVTGCGVQQSAGYVTESRGRLPSVHTPETVQAKRAPLPFAHGVLRTYGVQSEQSNAARKNARAQISGGGEAFNSALIRSQDGRL